MKKLSDSEKELMDLICNAIKNHRLIYFYYESKTSGNYYRKMEPYLVGRRKDGGKNLFFTGYVYPGNEKTSTQGNYHFDKIDLKRFKVLDVAFSELNCQQTGSMENCQMLISFAEWKGFINCAIQHVSCSCKNTSECM